MTRLTRADLDALPSYVPGRNVADLARELGISEAIKLASNEVPFGPLPGPALFEAHTEETLAWRAIVPRRKPRSRKRSARRTATRTWAWCSCGTSSPTGTEWTPTAW